MSIVMKEFTFSGHDSFALRHGWLKKVYDLVKQHENSSGSKLDDVDQNIFDPTTAMGTFGVGKNMVRAMRYWSLATGMVHVDSNQKYNASKLANMLMATGSQSDEPGADPFQESFGSIWLIHWELVTNSSMCTTWDYAFSKFSKTIFNKSDLLEELQSYIQGKGWKVSPNSLEKDINCFMQMYCPPEDNNSGIFKEESLECPLSELRLVSKDAASGGYRFDIGPKKTLPAFVLYYALAKYGSGRSSALLSLDEIFYEPGSPGKVFKLDENALSSLLERASEETNGLLEWRETGPLRQLQINEQLSNPIDLLKRGFAKTLQKREAA